MPISFFDLLEDDGWEQISVDPADPSFYWNDGGFMTSAPVDISATFEGATWHSTKIEPSFQWRGRRVRPSFTVPKRHHNFRQLMIVVSGEIDVGYGDADDRTQRVGAGEFWVGEAKLLYTLTSGPDGATYIECWSGPMSLVETYWHEDGHWIRR